MNSSFPIFCCSIALRQHQALEAARKIAAAGFAGVELWYPHVERMGRAQLEDFREACQSLGLTIGVLSPYFSFTQGREAWEQSLRTAGNVVHAADILGLQKIRTFIDCGPQGLPSKLASPEAWRAAREGLRTLCDMRPEFQFVVETHDETLADTLDSTQRIFDQVGRANLRLNYQPTRDFLQRGYLKCLDLLYPLISHMHWEQIREDGSSTYIEENGAIDFAALIAYLNGKSYRGTASVEYCWTPVDQHRLATSAQFIDRLNHASLEPAEMPSANLV